MGNVVGKCGVVCCMVFVVFWGGFFMAVMYNGSSWGELGGGRMAIVDDLPNPHFGDPPGNVWVILDRVDQQQPRTKA